VSGDDVEQLRPRGQAQRDRQPCTNERNEVTTPSNVAESGGLVGRRRRHSSQYYRRQCRTVELVMPKAGQVSQVSPVSQVGQVRQASQGHSRSRRVSRRGQARRRRRAGQAGRAGHDGRGVARRATQRVAGWVERQRTSGFSCGFWRPSVRCSRQTVRCRLVDTSSARRFDDAKPHYDFVNAGAGPSCLA